MTLPLPVGLMIRAIGWIKELLLKHLFLSTYVRSHGLWVKRHRLGTHWTECGDYFEYSLYLAQLTDPEPRESKIAIRAISEEIASLSLVLEARSASARFQERIELLNVNRKPLVCKLPNIPYQDVPEFHEQAGPLFSWDDYDISVTSLQLVNGNKMRPFKSMRASLSHTWFLNSRWERRWKCFWNLDAVKEAQLRIYQRWAFQVKYAYFGRELNLAQGLAVAAMRPFAWVMAQDWAIAAQFWIAIWSGLYVLNDKSELQWRWKDSSGTEN